MYLGCWTMGTYLGVLNKNWLSLDLDHRKDQRK